MSPARLPAAAVQYPGEPGDTSAIATTPTQLILEFLPLLQDAVARGDASPADVAYLTDRVLMGRGEPQIHGTQYQVSDGVLELWPVRDPAGLDQRRAALGLEPEAVNRARLLAAEGLTGEHQDDAPGGGG